LHGPWDGRNEGRGGEAEREAEVARNQEKKQSGYRRGRVGRVVP